MREMRESITRSINENINENFQKFDLKNAELEKKIEEQQNYIDRLDKSMRKKNVVFYGVEEKEKSYVELENSLLEVLEKVLQIPCDCWELEYVARLGKKNDKIRPIVVTFSTMRKKIEVMKKAKFLRDTKCIYNIKEDFPPNIQKKRKALQEVINKEREEGKNAVLRYDKIIYKLKRDNQNTTKNKRLFQASPEQAATINNEKEANKTIVQPQKKNKKDMRNFFSYADKNRE